MAWQCDTSLDVVAKQMAQHATMAIQEEIKKKIRAEADRIIEEAAREMAKNVVAHLERFTDFGTGSINLRLSVNNKEVQRDTQV